MRVHADDLDQQILLLQLIESMFIESMLKNTFFCIFFACVLDFYYVEDSKIVISHSYQHDFQIQLQNILYFVLDYLFFWMSFLNLCHQFP